jgi:hypothetical protein
MELHGLDADAQAGRDLLVGQAGGDQLEHLVLSGLQGAQELPEPAGLLLPSEFLALVCKHLPDRRAELLVGSGECFAQDASLLVGPLEGFVGVRAGQGVVEEVAEQAETQDQLCRPFAVRPEGREPERAPDGPGPPQGMVNWDFRPTWATYSRSALASAGRSSGTRNAAPSPTLLA